ncbi:MAG: hypothetical protein AAFP84_04540 [Actinomycetota bacterium]
MTRPVVGLLAVALLGAACTGDESSDPATTVSTTSTVEESPETTMDQSNVESTTTTDVTTTTDATTTSTTSTTSTTVSEPVDTDGDSIPITQEAFDEAFAAYEDAWRLRLAGQVEPESEQIRNQIRERYVDPFLTSLIEGFDQQLESGLRAEPRDDAEDVATLIRPIAAVSDDGEGTALIGVCVVETARVVDINTGEVVFETIVANNNDVDMVQQDGVWRVRDEITRTEAEGFECEPVT